MISCKISINKLIYCYVYMMFVYLSFEPVVLNVVNMISSSLLFPVRYSFEVVGYVLLVVTLIFKGMTGKKIKFNKLDLYITLTILVSVVSSMLYTSSFAVFLIGFRYFFRYVYIYILIRLSDWGTEQSKKIYKILLGILFIEYILCLWQLLDRSSSDLLLMPSYGEVIEGINSMMEQLSSDLAVYGSFGRYNMLGYFLALAIWYIMAERESCRDDERRKYTILLLLSFVLLFLSYSRQTLVAIVLAFIMFKLHKSKYGFKQLMTVSFITLVTVVTVFFVTAQSTLNLADTSGVGIVSASISDRYLSMLNLDFFIIDYIGYGRTWFITDGIALLLSENPVLGYGLGMYGCPDTISLDPSVYHMLGIPMTYYMDVFIGCIIGQVGLLGFLVYMKAYMVILKDAVKCSTHTLGNSREYIVTAITTYGVVLSTLLMMMFSSSLSNRVMGFFVWLMIGMMISMKQSEKGDGGARCGK